MFVADGSKKPEKPEKPVAVVGEASSGEKRLFCVYASILLGLLLLLLSPYVLLVGQPCPDSCHFYEKGVTFCGSRR
jgi:hypothetical protein